MSVTTLSTSEDETQHALGVAAVDRQLDGPRDRLVEPSVEEPAGDHGRRRRPSPYVRQNRSGRAAPRRCGLGSRRCAGLLFECRQLCTRPARVSSCWQRVRDVLAPGWPPASTRRRRFRPARRSRRGGRAAVPAVRSAPSGRSGLGPAARRGRSDRHGSPSVNGSMRSRFGALGMASATRARPRHRTDARRRDQAEARRRSTPRLRRHRRGRSPSGDVIARADRWGEEAVSEAAGPRSEIGHHGGEDLVDGRGVAGVVGGAVRGVGDAPQQSRGRRRRRRRSGRCGPAREA